jgi:hypothetical protein
MQLMRAAIPPEAIVFCLAIEFLMTAGNRAKIHHITASDNSVCSRKVCSSSFALANLLVSPS